jgi:hypothetical protein
MLMRRFISRGARRLVIWPQTVIMTEGLIKNGSHNINVSPSPLRKQGPGAAAAPLPPGFRFRGNDDN